MQSSKIEDSSYKLVFSSIKCKIAISNETNLCLIARTGNISSKLVKNDTKEEGTHLKFKNSLEVPFNISSAHRIKNNNSEQKCQIDLYKLRKVDNKEKKQLIAMAYVDMEAVTFRKQYKLVRMISTIDEKAYLEFNVKIELGRASIQNIQEDSYISSIYSSSDINSQRQGVELVVKNQQTKVLMSSSQRNGECIKISDQDCNKQKRIHTIGNDSLINNSKANQDDNLVDGNKQTTNTTTITITNTNQLNLFSNTTFLKHKGQTSSTQESWLGGEQKSLDAVSILESQIKMLSTKLESSESQVIKIKNMVTDVQEKKEQDIQKILAINLELQEQNKKLIEKIQNSQPSKQSSKQSIVVSEDNQSQKQQSQQIFPDNNSQLLKVESCISKKKLSIIIPNKQTKQQSSSPKKSQTQIKASIDVMTQTIQNLIKDTVVYTLNRLQSFGQIQDDRNDDEINVRLSLKQKPSLFYLNQKQNTYHQNQNSYEQQTHVLGKAIDSKKSFGLGQLEESLKQLESSSVQYSAEFGKELSFSKKFNFQHNNINFKYQPPHARKSEQFSRQMSYLQTNSEHSRSFIKFTPTNKFGSKYKAIGTVKDNQKDILSIFENDNIAKEPNTNQIEEYAQSPILPFLKKFRSNQNSEEEQSVDQILTKQTEAVSQIKKRQSQSPLQSPATLSYTNQQQIKNLIEQSITQSIQVKPQTPNKIQRYKLKLKTIKQEETNTNINEIAQEVINSKTQEINDNNRITLEMMNSKIEKYQKREKQLRKANSDLVFSLNKSMCDKQQLDKKLKDKCCLDFNELQQLFAQLQQLKQKVQQLERQSQNKDSKIKQLTENQEKYLEQINVLKTKMKEQHKKINQYRKFMYENDVSQKQKDIYSRMFYTMKSKISHVNSADNYQIVKINQDVCCIDSDVSIGPKIKNNQRKSKTIQKQNQYEDSFVNYPGQKMYTKRSNSRVMLKSSRYTSGRNSLDQSKCSFAKVKNFGDLSNTQKMYKTSTHSKLNSNDTKKCSIFKNKKSQLKITL